MFRAIDPGRKAMGWAVWNGAAPNSGVMTFQGDSEGRAYSRIYEQMRNFIGAGDVIGLEGALMMASMSAQSRFVLFGIRALVIMVSEQRGASLIEIPSATWRSKTHGATQAPKHIPKKEKTAWIKARAQEYVRRKGWGEVSTDAAEAICILDYLRSQHDDTYRHPQPSML